MKRIGTSQRKPNALHLRLAAFLLACAFLFLPGPLSGAERASGLGLPPWKEGDRLDDGWRIDSITQHEEFLRLDVKRQNEATEVEITYAREPSSPWEVGLYRVQPAPGSRPPEKLLKRVLADLKKLSATAAGPPFVRKHEVPVARVPDGGKTAELEKRAVEFANLGAIYLVLVLVATVLALVMSLCWRRLDATMRWFIPMVLGMMALLVACFVVLLPSRTIPIDWITVMHEGQGYGNIMQIYGQAAHAGKAYHQAVAFFLPQSATALHALVWFNLLLAGLNALLFLLIARFTTHTFWLAIPLTALFALNPITISSALSCLPSQSLTLFILLGICAVGLYHHRFAPQRAKRAAAVLLILVSVLASMTRTEFAALSLISLGMLGLNERYGKEWSKRFFSKIGAWLGAFIAWPTWKKAVLALVVGSGFFLVDFFSDLSGLVSPFIAMRLFNLAFLSSPIILGSLLPVGVILLSLLGLSFAFRHAARFLFLPISIILMYNLYANVSHGTYFEIIRYLTYIISLFFVLALFGWRELKWIAARMKWSVGTWRPIAIVLLALLFLAVPVHMRYRDFGNAENTKDLPFFGLSRNQQIATRYLLGTVENNPQCTFVSNVLRDRSHDSYELLFFGADFPTAMAVPINGQPLAALIRKYVPPTRRCVLYYHGLDCNRIDFDTCEDLPIGKDFKPCKRVAYKSCDTLHQGMALFDEFSFRSVPYSNEEEFGHFASQVNLRLYWIPNTASPETLTSLTPTRP